MNNFVQKNYDQLVIRKYNIPDQYYQTNDTTNGTMNITRFDVVAKIISGTFSFDAAQRDSLANIVHVTDGRFDITYK